MCINVIKIWEGTVASVGRRRPYWVLWSWSAAPVSTVANHGVRKVDSLWQSCVGLPNAAKVCWRYHRINLVMVFRCFIFSRQFSEFLFVFSVFLCGYICEICRYAYIYCTLYMNLKNIRTFQFLNIGLKFEKIIGLAMNKLLLFSLYNFRPYATFWCMLKNIPICKPRPLYWCHVRRLPWDGRRWLSWKQPWQPAMSGICTAIRRTTVRETRDYWHFESQLMPLWNPSNITAI